MQTNYATIYKAIKEQVLKHENTIKTNTGGYKHVVIYPFGELGAMTKGILNGIFGVQEAFIIDRDFKDDKRRIFSIEYLEKIDTSQYTFVITSNNKDYYDEIRSSLYRYVQKENIVDIFPRTKCGKYSYGPLCDHCFVEQVGAFSSFAQGTDVVSNHPVHYISTHPFIYCGNEVIDPMEYEGYSKANYYFPGVQPKGRDSSRRKIVIGNDVWLGRNVIITNYSNIGNGVIAAAGAVITKDIPDYAVVAGVPARIIRYRYNAEQIKRLNEIAWWDWADEKIRKYYDDFFIEINDFIRKHGQ